MRTILAALFVILALAVIPAAAQPLPPEGCERAGYVNLFNEAAILLDEDTSSDDPDILADMLTFIIHTIQSRRAECAGFTFEGAGGEVVGPFDLPAGDYIVTGEFTRSGNIFLNTLTDDCQLDLLGVSLGVFVGTGGSKQTVLQTDTRCRLLIEASTTAPWTLTFEPVGY